MPSCGLKNETLETINKILGKYSNIDKAVMFGSRAKGNFQPYSDIDIALVGDVDTSTAEYISCELDELPTAYTFDVTVYNAIKNDDFREHIDRVGVPIYEKGMKTISCSCLFS